MQVIFEKSTKDRQTYQLPDIDLPTDSIDDILGNLRREEPADLPELSELEVSRHFNALADRNHSVDKNFYPLGSCTMKYNPKINEKVSALDGFTGLHPYVEFFRAQGTMRLLYNLQQYLQELCGMKEFTLAPMAGAHGEFVGMSMIRAYHESRGEAEKRKYVLIPDSAHGTNPASAAIAGFKVRSVGSNADGEIDIEDLKVKMGDDVAGIMLTNPNTLGLFEKRILEISKIVHEGGGLLYYDGANLNAICGVCRPGDMGFDVIHLNLHKTFSTPHGGGGPGAGPVGVSKRLVPFLPIPRIVRAKIESPEIEFLWSKEFPDSIGRVSSFYGNIGVCIKAYAYIRSLGAEGLSDVARYSVLAANYLRVKLKDFFPTPFDKICMHEFISTPSQALLANGVHTLDIGKGLIERGIHPPTVYFPLIVPEAIMIEPTETEPLSTLDEFIEAMKEIEKEGQEEPQKLKDAPMNTPVGRLDETLAARKPILSFLINR